MSDSLSVSYNWLYESANQKVHEESKRATPEDRWPQIQLILKKVRKLSISSLNSCWLHGFTHFLFLLFFFFVVAQQQQKILLVLKKLIYESRQNVVTQNVVSCYCWGKAAYPGTTRNQIEDKLHLNHDVKVLCLYFLAERFWFKILKKNYFFLKRVHRMIVKHLKKFFSL